MENLNRMEKYKIEVYTYCKTILGRIKIVKAILLDIDYDTWTSFIRLKGKVVRIDPNKIYFYYQIPQLKERIKKMRIEGYEDYCR